MLDRPETELLGVRGLFLEAKREQRHRCGARRSPSGRSSAIRSSLGASTLCSILQAREGDLGGRAQHARHRPPERRPRCRRYGHRRRAVLLTAEAREPKATDPDKALALASEALRLAPSLVPAAEIAGRILASKGEARAASRLVSRTWKLAPHPDLALVYAFAKPGESPRERLKRIKHLAGLTPGDIEGHDRHRQCGDRGA